MAITSVDAALAGMRPPSEIVKGLTGTLVAGRAHSLLMMAGIPSPAVLGQGPTNIPESWTIVSSSIANPTVITVTGHPWANNDVVSIQGHTGSTPAIDGDYTITKTGANTFTIPVNVTTGGTAGVASGYTSAGGAGTSGAFLTDMIGKLPFTNPTGGNYSYLARLQAQATQAGTLMLCDRIYHNGGISPVKTTEQVFTNATNLTVPARDANGANGGVGVYAALEIIAGMGAGTMTPTIKYHGNVNGAGQVSGAPTTAYVASSIAGTFHIFPLNAGDTGVLHPESITLGVSGTSGKLSVVLFRVLARLELAGGALYPNAIDALTGGFPRMYDNTVPFLVFIPNTTTTSNVSGHMIYTQG